MKLKNYLSAKKLRRKLSKFNINETHCNTNDSFTDYNDNDTTPLTTTKDDMYIRPKREGGIGVRSDMTQSFSGCLPSYQSQQIQTDMSLDECETRDFGSQTDLQRSVSDDWQTYSPLSTNPDLFYYKDGINAVELSSLDSEETSDNCLCQSRRFSCSASDSSYYHSLPSTQPSHQYIQDIHYNSLPLSMTQSLYAGADHPAASTARQPDKWRRSRIKTNPWLPLPKASNTETLRRPRKVSERAEPRLSRFISEVEELMREQLSTANEEGPASLSGFLCRSNESLASTCSTATEVPERKLDRDVSPSSEGYKSACGSSDLNLADTEYFSAGSRLSSSSNLSRHCSDLETSRSGSGHCPPSLQDFNTTLNADNNNWTSSSSLLSESMFASSYSPKYEALEDKVRKLCQSTSDLDEKMRLARLECSYLQTLS